MQSYIAQVITIVILSLKKSSYARGKTILRHNNAKQLSLIKTQFEAWIPSIMKRTDVSQTSSGHDQQQNKKLHPEEGLMIKWNGTHAGRVRA